MCTALPFSVCGTIPYCIDESSRQSVKESRAEWESEKASIEKERAAHEAVVQAHSKDLFVDGSITEGYSSRMSVAKSFENIISQQFNEDVVEGEEQSYLDGEV